VGQGEKLMPTYQEKYRNTADIWFFEKPTIGFCKECNCTAEYAVTVGMRCPVCRTTKISIFVWDGESEYPE
jgi:hypothetical protein